ncbi:MAG TPA: TatD family hydrolase [Polyangia bacterium]
MIDTHCHLDAAAFDADRAEVLARARAAGVAEIVVPAVGPDGWEPLLEYAAAHPGVHAALGIHPQLLPALDPAQDERHLARLARLVAAGGAVAVGECGLDGPTAAQAGASMDRQVAVLAAHLDIARRAGRPILVHCLRAHAPLLALLAAQPGTIRGVLHSYSGGVDHIRPYAARGLAFSFAGPVTYEQARKPLAAVRAVPRDRLLVETDAPYQTPRPHRGRGEPAHLAAVAAAVAAALGLPLAELAALTTANARAVLGLPAAVAP